MRRVLFIGAACALIFLGMVWVLLSGTTEKNRVVVRSDAPDPIIEERKIVRDVTPDEILQSPAMEQLTLERLPDKKPPPLPKKQPEATSWKRPMVVSAGVFISKGTEIKLAGVEFVNLDKICIDHTKRNWPCGRFAKTAFSNYVRGRTIACDPVESQSDSITTHCKLGEKSLAKWLVANGWAVASDQTFRNEQSLAEKSFLGIWRKERP